MQFQDNEYSVTEDSITISKKALEDWRDHYVTISSEFKFSERPDMVMFYIGKADALTEILKHFEDTEI